MQNSMKFMFIGLFQLILRLDLRYLVGMLTLLRCILTFDLNDLGQGQGHLIQGQMAKIEGNNKWTSGHVQ